MSIPFLRLQFAEGMLDQVTTPAMVVFGQLDF
jgi:hypothetical protein